MQNYSTVSKCTGNVSASCIDSSGDFGCYLGTTPFGTSFTYTPAEITQIVNCLISSDTSSCLSQYPEIQTQISSPNYYGFLYTPTTIYFPTIAEIISNCGNNEIGLTSGFNGYLYNYISNRLVPIFQDGFPNYNNNSYFPIDITNYQSLCSKFPSSVPCTCYNNLANFGTLIGCNMGCVQNSADPLTILNCDSQGLTYSQYSSLPASTQSQILDGLYLTYRNTDSRTSGYFPLLPSVQIYANTYNLPTGNCYITFTPTNVNLRIKSFNSMGSACQSFITLSNSSGGVYPNAITNIYEEITPSTAALVVSSNSLDLALSSDDTVIIALISSITSTASALGFSFVGSYICVGGLTNTKNNIGGMHATNVGPRFLFDQPLSDVYIVNEQALQCWGPVIDPDIPAVAAGNSTCLAYFGVPGQTSTGECVVNPTNPRCGCVNPTTQQDLILCFSDCGSSVNPIPFLPNALPLITDCSINICDQQTNLEAGNNISTGSIQKVCNNTINTSSSSTTSNPNTGTVTTSTTPTTTPTVTQTAAPATTSSSFSSITLLLLFVMFIFILFIIYMISQKTEPTSNE